MRSQKALPSANLEALGKRVFGNGDSLGVVFDSKQSLHFMVRSDHHPSDRAPRAARGRSGCGHARS